jgi:flagellar hook-length control protein FliK
MRPTERDRLFPLPAVEMRSSVPRVASEPNAILSPNSQPSARNRSDAGGRNSAAPFASLLDGANPHADRPHASSDIPSKRHDRTGRDRNANPAGSTQSHAKTGHDKIGGSARTKDGAHSHNTKSSDQTPATDAGGTGQAEHDESTAPKTGENPAAADVSAAENAATAADAQTAEATPQDDAQDGAAPPGNDAAKNVLPVELAEAAQTDTPIEGDQGAKPSGKRGKNAKATDGADPSAGDGKTSNPAEAAPIQPDVVFSNAALAAASDATPETDALAALQSAGRHAASAKSPQPQTSGDTAPVDTAPDQPKGIAPADPQALAAGAANDKDGQAQAKISGPAEARLAGELLKKPHSDAAAQRDAATGALKAGTDAVQNLGAGAPGQPGTTGTANGATSAPATGPAQAQAAAVPLAGLAVEIAAQARAGKHHFAIRLDPPELGRIDVRLDVDRDGNVNSRLIVERADTLDLLKRDASQLERALQQAGLKTSDNALEFSLRQQTSGQDNTPKPQSTAQLVVPVDDPMPSEATRRGYGRLFGLGRGLDIRV